MGLIEEWLRRFDRDVVETAERLRALVRRSIPECEEALRPGWGLIGYRTRSGSRGRYFAFVAPQESDVLLGFEWGSLLTAHRHLLEKRGDQVACYRAGAGELPRTAITALLREAATLAELPPELRRERLAQMIR